MMLAIRTFAFFRRKRLFFGSKSAKRTAA